MCRKCQFQFGKTLVAGLFGAGRGADSYVAGGFLRGEAEATSCSVTMSPALEVFAYPAVSARVF